MSDVKLSREEAWMIDKALRLLRDKHYRHASEVSTETYDKNRKIFDKCDELRHRIVKEAC